MAESITDIVLETLGAYLKSNVSGVRQVIHGFPEPNINMKFPSISVLSKKPGYAGVDPYEYSKGQVSGTKAKVKFVVGQYDWKIQVDLWHLTREELDDLYEKFFSAVNPDIPDKSGLVLTMDKYHGNTCEYTMTAMQPMTEASESRRKQWRISIDLVANCLAIIEKEQYIITQPIEVQQSVGTGPVEDMTDNELN